MSIVTFLNENAGALNLLFGLIVALATVFYALLTRSLVKETKLLREAQTDPQVTVRIEPSDHWINLINIVVENSGSAPALDIRLKSDPDFETRKREHLSQFGIFKHGIRVLAPRQQIKTRLTIVTGELEEIERPHGRYQFTVGVRYRNVLGKDYEYSYPIDFRHLVGLRHGGSPPLHVIAKAVEELQKDVHRLASGFSKLRVIRQTTEEVQRDEDELLVQMRERQTDRSES